MSRHVLHVILSDECSLGKTIQTLARIVDGRAKKSDKQDGWTASTLYAVSTHFMREMAFISFL